jgi:hypothetical protein
MGKTTKRLNIGLLTKTDYSRNFEFGILSVEFGMKSYETKKINKNKIRKLKFVMCEGGGMVDAHG